MASAQLEAVIMLGETILRAKRYIVAFYFLWFWDYALTLGDEINYAWKGKKSWAFSLFLLNRYWPLPYLVWVFFASYWPGYSQKACDETAFLSIFYFNLVTFFAQTTLTLRLYVVTGKNKVLTSIPLCISLAQIVFGCYVWVDIRRHGSQHWPAIPFDSYHLCLFNQVRVQEVTLMSFSLLYDLLAFLIVVWVNHKVGGLGRSSRIPTILDTIVKDATVYFLVIFGSQLIVEFFILFAPSTYHLLPANSSAIFIPIMASRLMLSLKKAADGSYSATHTGDQGSEGVETDVLFAHRYHATMEYAMEAGLSRRDREQPTTDLELENLS